MLYCLKNKYSLSVCWAQKNKIILVYHGGLETAAMNYINIAGIENGDVFMLTWWAHGSGTKGSELWRFKSRWKARLFQCMNNRLVDIIPVTECHCPSHRDRFGVTDVKISPASLSTEAVTWNTHALSYFIESAGGANFPCHLPFPTLATLTGQQHCRGRSLLPLADHTGKACGWRGGRQSSSKPRALSEAAAQQGCLPCQSEPSPPCPTQRLLISIQDPFSY